MLLIIGVTGWIFVSRCADVVPWAAVRFLVSAEAFQMSSKRESA